MKHRIQGAIAAAGAVVMLTAGGATLLATSANAATPPLASGCLFYHTAGCR